MTESEFSHIFAVGKGSKPQTSIELSPDKSELKALAERFGLADIPEFTAKLDIVINDNHTEVQINGEIDARVVYICVVSLEKFESTVDCAFARVFDRSARPNDIDEEDIELDSLDVDTEYFEGNSLDIGELVAEEFGLALDLYPRKDGAVFNHKIVENINPDEAGFVKTNPFAALEALKKG